MNYPDEIASYLNDIWTDRINHLAMAGYIALLDQAILYSNTPEGFANDELELQIGLLKSHIKRYKAKSLAMRDTMVLIYN